MAVSPAAPQEELLAVQLGALRMFLPGSIPSRLMSPRSTQTEASDLALTLSPSLSREVILAGPDPTLSVILLVFIPSRPTTPVRAQPEVTAIVMTPSPAILPEAPPADPDPALRLVHLERTPTPLERTATILTTQTAPSAGPTVSHDTEIHQSSFMERLLVLQSTTLFQLVSLMTLLAAVAMDAMEQVVMIDHIEPRPIVPTPFLIDFLA
ncbi:hypothetical protein PV04_05363 [Phialophora macrospora]|uniref:Uncharacterized protein n=1 Tax=Phialophora macrospora TaxID=1851006 RepID=A0A0D2FSI4_9EURO|nr:hypothetical protein PV04_05363 [Phialophora macrospora]